ncbi:MULTISPECIES: hypothetical protein [unclassified Pseudomonas]|uniref:hypothetical protein n=1 Tax=unclassified Pseudomonas TaxID=196821 RepID=UPI000CD2B479|nr:MULTISPECIES: hypothetical protein [unclassified Pseudomonas]POA33957.1 hypothetical protein C1887_05825 [Pseudomonas sp. GW456-R21]POA65231.1 hypothetical protein C1884_18425 [Pseudomonas sp. GW460-R15]
MSQQPAENNLLLNGDFSRKGEHWTPNSPAKVEYSEDSCALQVNAQITQRVTVEGEGEFKFSVKMKTDSGSACQATVVMHPSKQRKQLDLGGGMHWTEKELHFSAPADTQHMEVKLLANDGVSSVFGSRFDDVVLKRL